MNIERLMKKKKMTPRELNRYLEIGFQVAMAFRPLPSHIEYIEHINNLAETDTLISGYLVALTFMPPTD
jgi:hypothetical protein